MLSGKRRVLLELLKGSFIQECDSKNKTRNVEFYYSTCSCLKEVGIKELKHYLLKVHKVCSETQNMPICMAFSSICIFEMQGFCTVFSYFLALFTIIMSNFFKLARSKSSTSSAVTRSITL